MPYEFLNTLRIACSNLDKRHFLHAVLEETGIRLYRCDIISYDEVLFSFTMTHLVYTKQPRRQQSIVKMA